MSHQAGEYYEQIDALKKRALETGGLDDVWALFNAVQPGMHPISDLMSFQNVALIALLKRAV